MLLLLLLAGGEEVDPSPPSGAGEATAAASAAADEAPTSLACLGSRTLQVAVEGEEALLGGGHRCSFPAASLARTENAHVPVPSPPYPFGDEQGSQEPRVEAPRSTTGAGGDEDAAADVVDDDVIVPFPPAAPPIPPSPILSSLQSNDTADASPFAARNENAAPLRVDGIGALLLVISATGAAVSTAKGADVATDEAEPLLPLPSPR